MNFTRAVSFVFCRSIQCRKICFFYHFTPLVESQFIILDYPSGVLMYREFVLCILDFANASVTFSTLLSPYKSNLPRNHCTRHRPYSSCTCFVFAFVCVASKQQQQINRADISSAVHNFISISVTPRA